MRFLLFCTFLFLAYLCSAQSLRPSNENEIVNHHYYELEYAEEHEQARWVFYELTKENIRGQAKRKNNFKSDLMISTGSSGPKDYKGSGYDRGHLAPAGSMKINQKAIDESFYMSNMSPQSPGLNRGKWRVLESQVRKWVLREGKLFVVTGGVLKGDLKKLGTSSISVPNLFYKVIYDSAGIKKMIAFLMPNRKLEGDIYDYQVAVDEVEERTGIDFFPALDDELENKLEAEIGDWNY